MRRLIVEDPMSRLATWSQRVGWLSLAVFLLAGVLVRWRRVELDPGLVALAAACGLAGLAVLMALAAFARIWVEGHKGFGRAVGGFLLGTVVLAYPAFVAGSTLAGPPMLDVTTDAARAPVFSASRPAVLARGGWVAPRTPPGLREGQRAAAPRLDGLTLEMPEDVAFALAREAAEARGFTIVEASAPGGRSAAGRIDARADTLVLRLPMELAIRVRPSPAGARVDVRAVSRAPLVDIGGPQATIERYLQEIDARASLL